MSNTTTDLPAFSDDEIGTVEHFAALCERFADASKAVRGEAGEHPFDGDALRRAARKMRAAAPADPTEPGYLVRVTDVEAHAVVAAEVFVRLLRAINGPRMDVTFEAHCDFPGTHGAAFGAANALAALRHKLDRAGFEGGLPDDESDAADDEDGEFSRADLGFE